MEQNITIDWDAVAAAAEAANVPYFTRRKWKERGSVPTSWWPALIAASDGRLSADGLLRLVNSAAIPDAAKETA